MCYPLEVKVVEGQLMTEGGYLPRAPYDVLFCVRRVCRDSRRDRARSRMASRLLAVVTNCANSYSAV